MKENVSNFDLSDLLNIYAPGANVALGSNTKAFAAELSAASGQQEDEANTEPSIEEKRSVVAAALEGKNLPYPNGITAESFKQHDIGGMQCHVLGHKDSASVPTLVRFH